MLRLLFRKAWRNPGRDRIPQIVEQSETCQDISVVNSPAFYEFAFILNSHINVRIKLSLFRSSMIHSLIGRFSYIIKLMPGLLPYTRTFSGTGCFNPNYDPWNSSYGIFYPAYSSFSFGSYPSRSWSERVQDRNPGMSGFSYQYSRSSGIMAETPI